MSSSVLRMVRAESRGRHSHEMPEQAELTLDEMARQAVCVRMFRQIDLDH